MSEAQSSTPQYLQEPLTEQELQAIRDAGASQAFLDVLTTDHPTGGRHSVRNEVKKQLRDWDEDPSEMTRLAGGFFTALWKGNRDVYASAADSNNKAILRAAGVV
jgi:hypothetical protein